MNKPLISIITVCYNAERTIGQTIASVLNQDYTNIEYILIDGASTDNTMNIVQSNISRITKYVSEPDKGLYDAINKGLDLATGDIIGLLHSDDFYPDNHVLSHIAEMFIRNPATEAVSSSVKIFKDDNFETAFRTYNAAKFRKWQFRMGIQPPHPGFFIRKEALKKVGHYDTSYKISGDFDWLLRALWIQGVKTFFTNFVSVFMRDGGMSSSGINSKRLMNSEDLRSLKEHRIYSNPLLIYSKYLIKVFQVNWVSFFRK